MFSLELSATPTMLGQHCFNGSILLTNLLKTCLRLFGVRATFTGGSVVLFVVIVAVDIVIIAQLSLNDRLRHFRFSNTRNTFVGVDKAREQVR